MKFRFFGEDVTVIFYKDSYAYNNRLYVGAITTEGEPWGDVTVNLPSCGCLEADEAFLDVNDSRELINAMVKNGYIELIGSAARSGYCEYPIGRFTEKFFKECMEG